MPSERETPKVTGLSGFWKSNWVMNCNYRKFSMYLLYVLVALNEEERVPVTIPSMNLALKPRTVSLKPS